MGYKILVVEDSSAMRSLVASIVESMEDHSVRQSSCGFEALRHMSQDRFDMIITDINMPDINGLEFLSYVRKNPLYKRTPLGIISTERSEKDRERGLSLGANEYLFKPFEPEELVQVIKKYLP